MLIVKPICTVFTPTIPIYVRPGGEDEDEDGMYVYEDMVFHVSSTDTMQEVRAFAVRSGVAIQHLSVLFFDHREQHLSVSLGDHACEQWFWPVIRICFLPRLPRAQITHPKEHYPDSSNLPPIPLSVYLPSLHSRKIV